LGVVGSEMEKQPGLPLTLVVCLALTPAFDDEQRTALSLQPSAFILSLGGLVNFPTGD
jgi:hypothetical protein